MRAWGGNLGITFSIFSLGLLFGGGVQGLVLFDRLVMAYLLFFPATVICAAPEAGFKYFSSEAKPAAAVVLV